MASLQVGGHPCNDVEPSMGWFAFPYAQILPKGQPVFAQGRQLHCLILGQRNGPFTFVVCLFFSHLLSWSN